MENWLFDKTILITGGTSGLGKSLVLKFLKHGCKVISISRNGTLVGIAPNKNYKHIPCDLAILSSVTDLVNFLLVEKFSVDILINNAGVLSPPEYRLSNDGFELSYQVNFLSHVYLTRELVKQKILKQGLIINVSSPIQAKGHINLDKALDENEYGLFQAYSNTKLYMALFSKHLSDLGYSSFSFNPGTFKSSIYQLQKKWFQILYRIAAPFMVSSKKVAYGLFQIIYDQSWQNGKMMNRNGIPNQIKDQDQTQLIEFWEKVDWQLNGG